MPKPPARFGWTPDDDLIAPYVDEYGVTVQCAYHISRIPTAPDERQTAFYAEQFPSHIEAINNHFARHCIACAERPATEAEVARFPGKLAACFPSSDGKDLAPYSVMLIEQLERLMPSGYALRRALLFFATREKSEWLPTVPQVVMKVSDEQRKVDTAVEALRQADKDIIRLEALPAFARALALGDVPLLEHKEQIPIDIIGVREKAEKEILH
jgi:hypothetical protein